MFIGFASLLERVDVINHRANPVLVEKRIHPIKRRAGSYGDAAKGGLAEDHRHQVERRGLAGQKADLSDASSRLCGSNRLIDAVATGHVEQQVHTLAVGELQHFLCPLGMGSVIHASDGPERFHRLQVFVLAGGRDDVRPQRRCNLRGKDRHATRALYENGLPGLDLAEIDQRVPGGQGRNRQGGGFFVRHGIWCAHGTLFMDDHVFGQATRQRRAKAVVGLVRAWRAVDPA